MDWMVLDGKLDGLHRHKSLINLILDGLDGLDGHFIQSGSERGKINRINIFGLFISPSFFLFKKI